MNNAMTVPALQLLVLFTLAKNRRAFSAGFHPKFVGGVTIFGSRLRHIYQDPKNIY